MALFRRSSDPVEAGYARLIDGEHLWLDVHDDSPLVLRREEADDIEVDVDPFPLASALAGVDTDQLELRLLAGGRPVSLAATSPGGPGVSCPPTRDRRWQFSVDTPDGEVVVRRTRLAPTVAVLGFATSEEGVVIRLATDADRVAIVAAGQELAGFPLTDGALQLGALPALAPGTIATFRVGEADVVRAGNVLERPMAAVALPPLPEPDVTLRWTPEAALSVRREDAS